MKRFQVIPREQGFYELFEKAAQNVTEAAALLLEMVTDYRDPEGSSAQIRQREHEGDEVTHQIMRSLATSFVTPFDREDTHELASTLDDIVDEIEAVADQFVLHHIERPLPEMRQQADVLARAASIVQEAIARLRSLTGLDPLLVEIHRLENEGDRVYRKTVAALFSGGYDAMDVLKSKEIVDSLERALDHCESVASTLETIALKHA
jgi:predicted phosphate transport protein (TIGR00153 family)